MIVIDASVVIAALTGDDRSASWASGLIATEAAAAPDHLRVEAAYALRRMRLLGALDPDEAAGAHADLLALDVRLHPYEIVGQRVWELHPNITAYDAAYVALAEMLDVPLATLDGRLTRAAGHTCEFLQP